MGLPVDPPTTPGGWTTTVWSAGSARPNVATALNVPGSRFLVLSLNAFHSSPTSASLPFQCATAAAAVAVAHAWSPGGRTVCGPVKSPTAGAVAGGVGGIVFLVCRTNLILMLTVTPA